MGHSRVIGFSVCIFGRNIAEAQDGMCPIASDIDFDHFITAVSARLPHGKLYFFIVISKHITGNNLSVKNIKSL